MWVCIRFTHILADRRCVCSRMLLTLSMTFSRCSRIMCRSPHRTSICNDDFYIRILLYADRCGRYVRAYIRADELFPPSTLYKVSHVPAATYCTSCHGAMLQRRRQDTDPQCTPIDHTHTDITHKHKYKHTKLKNSRRAPQHDFEHPRTTDAESSRIQISARERTSTSSVKHRMSTRSE